MSLSVGADASLSAENAKCRSADYELAIFNQTTATATAGGTFTSGAWQTRTLDATPIYYKQVGTGTAWASVSSNQITLQPGTYRIKASAPGYSVNRHIARFQNITDGTTDVQGTSQFNSTSGNPTRSWLCGTITITSAKTFEIQHRCQSTSPAGDRFGIANTIDGLNVYTMIRIDRMSSPSDCITTRSFIPDMVIYYDIKAPTTDGGTFTSGAWQTRTLNTEVYSRQTGTSWASLGSNQITLQAGKYLIEAECPAYAVNRHWTRVQNITGGTTEQYGTSEFSRSTAGIGVTDSFICCVLEPTAATTYEIQHRCQTTKTVNGFGIQAVYGDSIYTKVVITKLA